MALSLDTKDAAADEMLPLKPRVSLAGFTSYRVGGQAEWFSLPKNRTQLILSLQWASRRDMPVKVLGAGSNLLISDCGLSGLVVCSRHLRGLTFGDDTGQITAAAGEPLPNLAWKAARKGWRGLEWAVGIPGTVGGAIFMNAGAQGVCSADRLVQAEAVSLSGEPCSLSPENLDFSYRTSSLQSHFCLVTQATFQASPGHDPKEVMADTQAALERRRLTQPYHLPSCGSVFRNPSPYAAGWLIEQTGLKGYQIGQAQVSPLHANFVVNLGGAKAKDILRLVQSVQVRVQEQWSVLLHPEVRLLGDFETCCG